jgi:hypothetical protein
MTDTVQEQLRRQVRWITAGFVALMLLGFGLLLLLPGNDANLFDSPLGLVIIIGGLSYAYAVRCRCPRCGKRVTGIYGRVPASCPWCGLRFDAPWHPPPDPDRTAS